MFVEGLHTVARGPIISAVDCLSSWGSTTWPDTVCGRRLFVDVGMKLNQLRWCVPNPKRPCAHFFWQTVPWNYDFN